MKKTYIIMQIAERDDGVTAQEPIAILTDRASAYDWYSKLHFAVIVLKRQKAFEGGAKFWYEVKSFVPDDIKGLNSAMNFLASCCILRSKTA